MRREFRILLLVTGLLIWASAAAAQDTPADTVLAEPVTADPVTTDPATADAPAAAPPDTAMAPETPHFVPLTDRWRDIKPPPYELNVEGRWYDPYNQNTLKGDRPY